MERREEDVGDFIPLNDSPPLFDLLSDELRDRALEGSVKVWPGKNPLKPYVTDAVTGKVVKGSGRPAGGNDLGLISKQTAFKRSRNYREALQAFFPADRNGSPDAIGSLQEMAELLMKAVRGKPVALSCPSCKHSFEVPIQPDTKALTWAMENLAGRARETTDINLRSEQIIQILHDPTPENIIEVVSISPEERAERALAVRNAD